MAANHPMGMGEQPFGNKYEMIAAANSGEQVNPVTHPFDFGVTKTIGNVTLKHPDGSILGPASLSNERLGYRLLK
jgi:hypothetical protein